tara:strand:+ start:88 stop:519 length:432 start_codon:yes stop_codon:yes gene_type:complete
MARSKLRNTEGLKIGSKKQREKLLASVMQLTNYRDPDNPYTSVTFRDDGDPTVTTFDTHVPGKPLLSNTKKTRSPNAAHPVEFNDPDLEKYRTYDGDINLRTGALSAWELQEGNAKKARKGFEASERKNRELMFKYLKNRYTK